MGTFFHTRNILTDPDSFFYNSLFSYFTLMFGLFLVQLYSLFHADVQPTPSQASGNNNPFSFCRLSMFSLVPGGRAVSSVVNQRAGIAGSLPEQAGRKERQAPHEPTAVCRRFAPG